MCSSLAFSLGCRKAQYIDLLRFHLCPWLLILFFRYLRPRTPAGNPPLSRRPGCSDPSSSIFRRALSQPHTAYLAVPHVVWALRPQPANGPSLRVSPSSGSCLLSAALFVRRRYSVSCCPRPAPLLLPLLLPWSSVVPCSPSSVLRSPQPLPVKSTTSLQAR